MGRRSRPHVDSLPTPRLRGRIHQAAFVASIPAGIVLVALAGSTLARGASVVYGLSLTGLFGASAAYHRLRVTVRVKRLMRRLDHSMIFVLIAGTYTPIALLVLRRPLAIALLVVVWSLAALGVTMKVLGADRLNRASFALYLGMGWMAAATLPQLVGGLDGLDIALLLVGCGLYNVGAVILVSRRPDPVPLVFGYHEVWHALVVVAGVCHYAVILSLVRGAAS